MKPISTHTGSEFRRVGSLALTVALATVIGGLTALSARADNYDHGRDQGQYQQRDGDHRDWHQRDYYNVYAPPPVYYYAPPPQQPVIDFVFPLNFR